MRGCLSLAVSAARRIFIVGLLLAPTLLQATHISELIIDVPAGEVLPGSYVEITWSETVPFYFITEGGFAVSGSALYLSPGIAAPVRLGEPLEGPSGFASPDAWDFSVSEPFPEPNDRYTGFYFEFKGAQAIANGEPVVTAPFTLEGSYFDAFSDDPPYYQADFSGHGTVYYTVRSCATCSDPENEFEATKVRYEFESITSVPEPGSWSLVLLGLLSAGLISRLRKGV